MQSNKTISRLTLKNETFHFFFFFSPRTIVQGVFHTKEQQLELITYKSFKLPVHFCFCAQKRILHLQSLSLSKGWHWGEVEYQCIY